MKRVDYPDEEGYWWVIRKCDNFLMSRPIKFYEWSSWMLVSADDEYAPYDDGRYEFEGPIPQPRMPMRFETKGKINAVTESCGLIWYSVMPNDIAPHIQKTMVNKMFKITFEEVL